MWPKLESAPLSPPNGCQCRHFCREKQQKNKSRQLWVFCEDYLAQRTWDKDRKSLVPGSGKMNENKYAWSASRPRRQWPVTWSPVTGRCVGGGGGSQTVQQGLPSTGHPKNYRFTKRATWVARNWSFWPSWAPTLRTFTVRHEAAF